MLKGLQALNGRSPIIIRKEEAILFGDSRNIFSHEQVDIEEIINRKRRVFNTYGFKFFGANTGIALMRDQPW